MRPMGDWSMRMTLSIWSCAGEGLVRAGFFARAVEIFGERAVENVVDEGAFAAAADAGDDGHDAERNADVDVLQIVFARAGDGEPLAGERARLGAMEHAVAPER